MELSKHQKIISEFAKKSFDDWRFSEDYNERVKDVKDVWTKFQDFTITSPTEIQINYTYGSSDPLSTDLRPRYSSFKVNILPETRNDKIIEILNEKD